ILERQLAIGPDDRRQRCRRQQPSRLKCLKNALNCARDNPAPASVAPFSHESSPSSMEILNSAAAHPRDAARLQKPQRLLCDKIPHKQNYHQLSLSSSEKRRPDRLLASMPGVSCPRSDLPRAFLEVRLNPTIIQVCGVLLHHSPPVSRSHA